MGLAIYAYHEASKNECSRMLKLANKFIASIYNSPPTDDISLENGLLGIALGLKYLLSKGFVEGDENDILKDIDDELYKRLYFYYLTADKPKVIDDYILILQTSLYFAKRLENIKLNKLERLLFEKILIKAINEVDESMQQVKIIHPNIFLKNHYLPFLYFSLITKMYSLKIYEYKLDIICKKWNENILTIYPMQDFNKLLVTNAIDNLMLYYKNERWSSHLNILRNKICINEIINNEFGNKNIFLHGGISGFHSFCKSNKIITYKEENSIIERIVMSELWNDIEKNKNEYLGLYSGVYGILLSLQGICIDEILN